MENNDNDKKQPTVVGLTVMMAIVAVVACIVYIVCNTFYM